MKREMFCIGLISILLFSGIGASQSINSDVDEKVEKASEDWIAEEIQKGTIFEPKMVLDSEDFSHIVYFYKPSEQIRYSRWTGNSWKTYKIDKATGRGSQAYSISIDSKNIPGICYYTDKDYEEQLIYAQLKGGKLTSEKVTDKTFWIESSKLLYDENDNPHIFYKKMKSTGVEGCFYEECKYAYKQDNEWKINKIVPNDDEYYTGSTSAKFDVNNELYFLYIQGNYTIYPHYIPTLDLNLAKWDGVEWQKEPVFSSIEDDEGEIQVKLDFGSDNEPRITWRSPSKIKFIEKINGNWEITSVIDMPELGPDRKIRSYNFKLEYDRYNNLHVCYSTESDTYIGDPNYYTEVFYGTYDFDADRWVLEQIGRSIDGDAGYGHYQSLQFDNFNSPHIVFQDSYRWGIDGQPHEGGLLYARKGDLVENDNPKIPEKPKGKLIGAKRIEQIYSTVSTDPEGDEIMYGWEQHGDDTVDGWTDFQGSGIKATYSKTWYYEGKYSIRVKAIDEHGAESDWSEPLEVTLISSRSRSIFDRFFQLFPNITQILEMFLHL